MRLKDDASDRPMVAQVGDEWDRVIEMDICETRGCSQRQGWMVLEVVTQGDGQMHRKGELGGRVREG